MLGGELANVLAINLFDLQLLVSEENLQVIVDDGTILLQDRLVNWTLIARVFGQLTTLSVRRKLH